MITSLWVKNFRSLEDFTWPEANSQPLGAFVCLVGWNGAGKSSVLQCLSFLSQLAHGDVDEWLKQRGWKSQDLANRWSGKRNISFALGFNFQGRDYTWSGVYNSRLHRCTSEWVAEVDGPELLRLRSGELLITPRERSKKDFRLDLKVTQYQGSCLSWLNPSKLPSELQELTQLLTSMRSLDLLSPDRMRRRTKEARDLGHGGENLSAFLAGLSRAQKQKVLDDLQKLIPSVLSLQAQTLRAGWKQLLIEENFGLREALFSNRDLSDGFLRILAIIAQCVGPDRVSLFDEIENGVHPELAEKLIGYLIRQSKEQQIVVTTHNPMLLNFIPDELARKAVFLVYKVQGATRIRRYFDSALTRDKLGLMGAGEVYVDTPIQQLVRDGT